MTEEKKEYIKMMKKTANNLWGEEDVININQHLEATASAIWNVGQISLDPKNEPATKFRYGEGV